MTLTETKKMLGTVTVFAMAWAVMIASLFWLNADCQAQGDHARRTLWMRDCTKVCIAAVSFNVVGAWMQMHRPQAAPHGQEQRR